MLASFQDYLFLWQLPLLGVFVVGWIGGGGYLLRWSIRRLRLRRRVKLERCVLASLLAGSAGVFAGGAVLMLAISIGQALNVSLDVPAIVLSGLALLTVSFLVLYAMFEFPARSLLAAAAVPLGATLLLGALVATAAGVPAYYLRHKKAKHRLCQRNLAEIHKAVTAYCWTHTDPPRTLQALVDEKYIRQEYIRCAAAPDAETGFFYFPSRPLPANRRTRELLACDLPGRHGDDARAMVFLNGTGDWKSEEHFQALLREPENARFAEALGKAEAK